MKAAVVGCGWLGERLAAYLVKQGLQVIATTTSPEKLKPISASGAEAHLLEFGKTTDFTFLNDCDAAIFSMPAAKDNWHEGFMQMNKNFQKTIFFSSTGIYPQSAGIFSEEQHENLRADLAASEEIIRTKFPQTNILRLAGLMGDERNLTNFFKNRAPGDPDKAVNHIHYKDIVRAVHLLLESDIHSEIFNLVAPKHPTIAQILNIPGDHTGKSARIISAEKFIQNFNYKFIHPNPQYFSR